MPSGSTSPVTRPNSVSTPTCPVGIDVVEAINRMNTTTTPTMVKNRDFKPLKFGIPGFPPPKLNSTFAIKFSFGSFERAAQHFVASHLTSHFYPVLPYLIILSSFSLDTLSLPEQNPGH